MEYIRLSRRLVVTRTHYNGQRAELQRFCELLQAFVDLAAERDDLQLRGSADPPPLGFAVRLQPAPRAPGIEMSLSMHAVKLSRWTAAGGRWGREANDRVLNLDLGTGFRWECLIFPDADHLARTLLRRMVDELEQST